MAQISARGIPFRFPDPYKLNGVTYYFGTQLVAQPVVSESSTRIVLKGKISAGSDDPEDSEKFSVAAEFDIRFRGIDSQGKAIVDVFITDRESGAHLLSVLDARVSKSQAARLSEKGTDRQLFSILTQGDDHFSGSPYADRIDSRGDDTLLGKGGDDYLTGDGHDQIDGGDGNDVIRGHSSGDGAVFGGAGDDHIVWGSGHVIDGGGGDDWIEVKNSDPDVPGIVDGGSGDDLIAVGVTIAESSGFNDGPTKVVGGPGRDLFMVGVHEGHEGLVTIADFKRGVDQISLEFYGPEPAVEVWRSGVADAAAQTGLSDLIDSIKLELANFAADIVEMSVDAVAARSELQFDVSARRPYELQRAEQAKFFGFGVHDESDAMEKLAAVLDGVRAWRLAVNDGGANVDNLAAQAVFSNESGVISIGDGEITVHSETTGTFMSSAMNNVSFRFEDGAKFVVSSSPDLMFNDPPGAERAFSTKDGYDEYILAAPEIYSFDMRQSGDHGVLFVPGKAFLRVLDTRLSDLQVGENLTTNEIDSLTLPWSQGLRVCPGS